MRKYLEDIIYLAENPIDCMGNNITNKWGYEPLNHERFESFAGMIYTDILRKIRKWYQHPKWHFWHWEFQIHPLQRIKRRYFDKCYICGKRGFKGAAFGDWNGTKLWHAKCDRTTANPNNKIIATIIQN